jgi:CubicO group peptidase (beta-lactamase class C family)
MNFMKPFICCSSFRTHSQLKILEDKIKADYGNIAGLVVCRNGHTLYEKYFDGCDAKSRVHIYSVTKGILALLYGVAIDKGYIKSVHQHVLDFFPDYQIKRREKILQKITIRDMLTMTVPHSYKFPPYTYIRYFMSDDWVKFGLDSLGGKDAIGTFNYVPFAVADVLSGILAKAVGESVFDFATKNLFLPLDITVEKNVILHTVKEQQAFNKATNISGWVADSKGINAGGWGLTLSPVDMAKIGQLLLNRGEWNGGRIISAEWIDEATKEHSRWEKLNLSYGYLWWLIDSDKRTCAAMGDGGNVIYFNAEANMVVAIASLFVQKAKNRIELINQFIEPLFCEQ